VNWKNLVAFPVFVLLVGVLPLVGLAVFYSKRKEDRKCK